jgi:hypothetical protein
MPSSSKIQNLSTALSRGLISQEQFDRGKSKLDQREQDNAISSKHNSLKLALERGLISQEQFDKGNMKLSRPLQNSQEQTPEAQNPQEEEFGDYSKRAIARGTKNVVVGALDVADFLASPIRAGLNLGIHGVSKAMGVENPYQIPALGEEASKAIDTSTGGYTESRTPEEKTSEAMVRGLSTLPVGLGLGAAAKGAQYLPKTIQAGAEFLRGSNVLTGTQGAANVAGTAATSGLIQSALNENPENVPGAIGAGLVGGIAAPAAIGALSALTKGGRQRGASRVGEFLNINPEAVESFDKSGITPMLADVSRSTIPKTLTSKLENLPFSAKPIREAKELQRKQVAQGLGQGEHGRNLSKSEASQLVTKGAKEYQKGKSKEFGSMFDKVEKDIGKLPDDTISIENTKKYFDSHLKNIKTPSQEKRFLKSPIGKFYTDLYETSKTNNGKIPYHDAKERLDEINDLITTHGQIGKVSQGKLKQFASHLSKDIESSLEPKFKKLGPESYKNWKEAKKHYAQYAQEEIPKLNEIYKKDKKGATDAFIDLMSNQKKGAEKARIAMKGLSHTDQIDLMDAVNKNLGAKSDGTFSPLVWARKYKSIDPEAQNILLSPLSKESKNKVNYIAESIDRIKETLEKANTSATAYHTAIGALGAAGYSAAKVALVTGNPIPAGILGTGLFLQKVGTEKILTNPKFINWMYKGMKANNLGHFERNLERIPKIGNLRKTLVREVQNFQHDLNESKEEKEKKNDR